MALKISNIFQTGKYNSIKSIICLNKWLAKNLLLISTTSRQNLGPNKYQKIHTGKKKKIYI